MAHPGRPAIRPAPQIRVRLEQAIIDRIDAAAAADDRSREAWLRRAIEAALPVVETPRE